MGGIVDLQIGRLIKQLAQNEIALQVTENARNAIANAGYDPIYGARPLKRVIQQKIQNPLATELLRGRVSAGGAVRVDYRDDEFTFEPLEEVAAV